MPYDVETMPSQQMYLSTGEGAIDPARRVAAGELSDTEIDAFCEALNTDEFDADISETAVPKVCVDGRPQADGEQLLGPNSAGGTFTMVVADALTSNAYRKTGETAEQHAKTVYSELQKSGYEIGVHDDDRATGSNCGCGAEDRLDSVQPGYATILGFIERRGSELVTMLRSLDVEVSEELEAGVIAKASQLRADGYFTSGAGLRDAARSIQESSVVTLSGAHGELVGRINMIAGKTLDRKKLAARYGANMQAFNIDVPAIMFAADKLSLNPEEAHNKFVAALVYNLATASVLAGPSLRVLVHA